MSLVCVFFCLFVARNGFLSVDSTQLVGFWVSHSPNASSMHTEQSHRVDMHTHSAESDGDRTAEEQIQVRFSVQFMCGVRCRPILGMCSTEEVIYVFMCS
jgi:hypothetical protein